MSDRDPNNSIALLILAGVGAGALTGALVGLLASRRPQAQAHDGGDTVEDLKRRAEQILAELSQSESLLPEPVRPRNSRAE